jgi:ubiquinone/menaquinone biosynthesis C-methylase UbiE
MSDDLSRPRPQANRGYGRGAEHYDQGRPGYPTELAAWLKGGIANLGGQRWADVGAGTGKFTVLLSSCVREIVAVEPVFAMRMILARRLPNVAVIGGTAERLPMPADHLHGVAVAQAFHWLRQPAALDEFARVLRPDGHLLVVYNNREPDDPVQARLEAILSRFRHWPRYGDEWRELPIAHGAFEAVDSFELSTLQQLDAEQLVARIASSSYIAPLPDSIRKATLDEVRAIALTGEVVLHYRTMAKLFRRRS